jgi:exonuclease III
MSFNVEGLRTITDQCDLSALVEKYDFVFLVETFTKTIPESIFPSHNVYGSAGVKINDNVHGRLSGGVGCLVKKNISQFVERLDTEIDNFVILKLSQRLLGTSSDCLLVGCYIPPDNSPYYAETDIYNGISLLEDCLLELAKDYGDLPVIICGDLNARTGSAQAVKRDPIDDLHDMTAADDDVDTDVDNGTKRQSLDRTINAFGRLLLSVCEEFDLCILNGIISKNFCGKHTYVSHNGSSVLDYFLVSRSLLSNCHSLGVIPMIESKHALVELSFKKPLAAETSENLGKSTAKVSKFKWNEEFREQFILSMQSDVVNTKLAKASDLINTDINLALSEFNDCLSSAGECMKVTHSVGSEKLKVWFDLECKQSRQQLRRSLRRFHTSNCVEDRHEYAEKRRQYKELLRNKKRTHKEKILGDLNNYANDPRKFWETLRSVRRKDSAARNSISSQQWHDHFKNVFNTPSDGEHHDADVLNDVTFNIMNDDVTDCDVVNAPITEEEVRAAIKALKNQKAAGPDSLIGEFYKHSCEQILPFFIKFFNHLFDNGLFPDKWSLSVLQPLHKKGDVTVPDNYRGISLLDISSKLYSYVLNKRITDWIETNGILGDEQAGFREDHSTTDHIFTLLALVQKQLLRHRKLYVAFIDFRKAFDSICRNRLWTVLRKSGLNGKIVAALQSMYRVVKARVRVGADLTDEFLCPQGLKQGEVCSPVLFSLFINELTKDIVNSDTHGIQLAPEILELFILLFADDVILFSDTVIGLQTQLNVLCESAKRLGLVVNLDKSDIVVFRNGGFLGVRERWLFDGVEMRTVNMYKYLGIFMSTKLSFQHAFKDLAERARKGVAAIMKFLWTVGEFSPKIFFKLFDCQIQPILTYGSEVWGLTPDQECLERVHLVALKRFLGVSYKSPRHLIYGETGRYPLYVATYSRCVKFWLRLTMLNTDRLPKKAYNMLLSLQRQNYTTWACKVRNVLYRFGFGIVWETQGVGNVKLFLFEFKQRLIDCFTQDWSSAMTTHDFYYVYSSFKREIFCSDHLYILRNMSVRKTFTRFRIGMSPLRSRAVEFQPERFNNHECPFCQNVDESEFHFLLVCPKYSDLRDELIPSKYAQRPNLFKLVLLLSSTNESIISNLSYYVSRALAVRHHALTS